MDSQPKTNRDRCADHVFAPILVNHVKRFSNIQFCGFAACPIEMLLIHRSGPSLARDGASPINNPCKATAHQVDPCLKDTAPPRRSAIHVLNPSNPFYGGASPSFLL